MTSDDIKQISKLLDEKLDERITVSEERLRSEILASEKRIIKEIGDFVDQTLLPQIGDKADRSDIERVDRRIDALATKVGEQDKRLQDVESVPTIAHELKLKKKKT